MKSVLIHPYDFLQARTPVCAHRSLLPSGATSKRAVPATTITARRLRPLKKGAICFNLLFLLLAAPRMQAQVTKEFADSIRGRYLIPELAYAVVTADSILVLETIGVQRNNLGYRAGPNDRFHLGSNTKAITAFLAALLVEEGKIKWDTKFFDLFPQLRKNSKPAYQNITLENLVTFRGKLPPYTYTTKRPTLQQITGTDAQQRLLLARYFLSHKPMKRADGLTPSNADYILAGLMLEKAAGKSYQELVTALGKTLGIDFGFDYPNLADTLQPWGHDSALRPLPPAIHKKMNWLLSAGNINVSMEGYCTFIQLLLQGINGRAPMLSQNTYTRLLFGLPRFSYGWFTKVDSVNGYHIAYNQGNAGAFTTQVEVIRERSQAIIIFTNAATEKTAEGIEELKKFLYRAYCADGDR